MKILHAIQSVDPVGGGPVESIKQFAQATGREHQHRVVCMDAPNAAHVREFPLPVDALGPAAFLGYSPRLKPWMLAHAGEFDCVIIHGLWRYISFGSWRALRDCSGTPYAVMVHGMLDPWFKYTFPLKHLKKWLFWPWSEYRVLRDAHTVIYNCEEERVLARKSFWLYHAREAVVPHVVSGPVGERNLLRRKFLDAFPEANHRHCVLYLGRMHPIKGCDLLLRAFARTASADPNLHLIMAGPLTGDYAQHLQREAVRLGLSGRITWTGMLEGDLKWGALHAAKVFILPSHVESFGISVAEALACGLPVLVSDKVKIWPDIIADGAGMVEPDTAEGTSRLLDRWTALSELARARMERRASTCYGARFAPAHAARRFLEVLQQMHEHPVVLTGLHAGQQASRAAALKSIAVKPTSAGRGAGK